MNDSTDYPRSNPLASELFVFSPSGGVSLNINPKSLPQHDPQSEAKFELIGTNPLIKTNKNSKFAEYDHYIEDPTNPEIKNAVLNNIGCVEGIPCLKKDAVDIIYCSFEAFKDNGKFDISTSVHVSFYVNMLLMYPPELKHNALIQYFATLEKLLENNFVSLDTKYLLTSKALEVEWERCSFGKYSLFKGFFVSMKRFFKQSPLFVKPTFADEATSNAYQELLIRTLNGRAFVILKYIVDSEDPLKILMLFKAIEWMQKLEGLKLLPIFNVNYLINRGKDKFAVDMIKQMYGKAPMVMPTQKIDPENEELLPVHTVKEENIAKPINGTPQVGVSSTSGAQATKKATEAKKKSLDVEREREETNLKAKQSPTKTKKKESNAERLLDEGLNKRKDSSVERREPAKQEENKNGKKVKTERISLFFDLFDTNKYEDDFGGRISNFLRKARKIGYDFESGDQSKIESIISKFNKNYTDDQKLEISKNYVKFCGEYSLTTNSQTLVSLQTAETKIQAVIIKEPAISKNEGIAPITKNVAPNPVKPANKEKPSEPVSISGATKQKGKDQKGPTGKPDQTDNLRKISGAEENARKKSSDVFRKGSGPEDTIKASKPEVKPPRDNQYAKTQKPEEKPDTAEKNVIYCKNVSPISEQMTINKKLFDRASKVHDDLERILNKKFAYLKVIKIGSIGCGYATNVTNNLNLALTRKDLSVSVDESQLIEEVYTFLTQNYFSEDSNSHIETKFNKRTISWTNHKDIEFKCTLIYDNANIYRDLSQKIKLYISSQPSILRVFYQLQEDLSNKGLLSQDKVSSYLLLIMLITSCQLEFDSKKYLQGLKENTTIHTRHRVKEDELLKRFTTIFHNCIQNEVSKNYYFSLLRGCLDQIAVSKSHFAQDDCFIYLEDPFQPDINCAKNLNHANSEPIIDFIEGLYMSYGV